jgi:hypothetical protein
MLVCLWTLLHHCAGKYVVVMDSDAWHFGGQGRVAWDAEHFTTPAADEEGGKFNERDQYFQVRFQGQGIGFQGCGIQCLGLWDAKVQGFGIQGSGFWDTRFRRMGPVVISKCIASRFGAGLLALATVHALRHGCMFVVHAATPGGGVRHGLQEGHVHIHH